MTRIDRTAIDMMIIVYFLNIFCIYALLLSILDSFLNYTTLFIRHIGFSNIFPISGQAKSGQPELSAFLGLLFYCNTPKVYI
ncbi:hypothetical protein SDC9_194185 [bioreactor metagenome]|uniref:Uncharacterized protein n=1 Tax=bioreactor metagenome TaxID=1076179 RepID=A0A645IE75_9ZZZZ